MPVEAGQVIAERYRLVRPIGKGAQASVWIAEHLALGSQVAVKVMDPELVEQSDARDRFKREATAAAQLRSAHVVQILDHGIDGGQPFMVMELLDGEDLFQRLERKNRLTLPEASVIVTQIARALARAHAAGIVHRDLKPENVFLVPNEDDEIAKVLDFGVAKFLEAGAATRRTSAGTLLGTPHYMSPEQVRGVGEIDHRSDLWSLGVIAYQLTTGDLPFESEGVGDLLIKITMDRIPVPSHRRKDLPRSFDEWFGKACHRDVDRRFQTAREMAEALARVAGLVPPPAESLRGATLQQAKALSEPPAFDVDFEDVELPPAPPVPALLGAGRGGKAPPAPPQRPPPPGAAISRPTPAVADVDDEWPDEPPPSLAPPPPAAAVGALAPAAPAAPPSSTAPARGVDPAPAAVAPQPTAVAPPPPPRPPAPAPRAPAPAAAPAAAPPDASEPPRSKSQLSSTISGAAGDVIPPPELDGSRKRRTVLLVAVAAALGAGGLALAVVQSHAVGDPRPVPAATVEPAPEREPPAVVEPPAPPSATVAASASASASAVAVDPGRSRRPIKNAAAPSPRPPTTGGSRRPPPPAPPASDGEVIIEVPLPEREVPVPPAP